MNDSYIDAITALLPLTACILVFQSNPYHALVIRGILGAIAALVYAVLGAADVALTEALVGTMLAITLYAVAVRSSMVMRLGVLKEETDAPEGKRQFEQLMGDLQVILGKHHLRLELVSYEDREDLQRALMTREIHATCIRQALEGLESGQQPYQSATRIPRLHDILQAELPPATTVFNYVSISDVGEEQP